VNGDAQKIRISGLKENKPNDSVVYVTAFGVISSGDWHRANPVSKPEYPCFQRNALSARVLVDAGFG
jgi:hypothetical protein